MYTNIVQYPNFHNTPHSVTPYLSTSRTSHAHNPILHHTTWHLFDITSHSYHTLPRPHHAHIAICHTHITSHHFVVIWHSHNAIWRTSHHITSIWCDTKSRYFHITYSTSISRTSYPYHTPISSLWCHVTFMSHRIMSTPRAHHTYITSHHFNITLHSYYIISLYHVYITPCHMYITLHLIGSYLYKTHIV